MRHVPTSVYIDTEIFYRNGLRFDTQSFTTLKNTFVPKGLRLLVPEMMERELLRHFQRRAEQVASEIIKSHKDIKTHTVYPANKLVVAELPAQKEIESICLEEMKRQWIEFKDHFVVERLPIIGNLEEVVDWYFAVLPPFTEKKPKEFPDALIVSALDKYHNQNRVNIAVISADGGFHEACVNRNYFRYFNDPRIYTEAFQPELSGEDRLPGDIDLTKPITTEDLTELKAILSLGNRVTPIEIDRAMNLLEGRGTNYEYFFQNADDTVWLQPLSERGHFDNPPDKKETTEGYIDSPWWPPLDYLIRIFEAAPTEVMDILSELPDTDNYRVLEGIFEIVLKADSPEAVSRFSRFITASIEHSQ